MEVLVEEAKVTHSLIGGRLELRHCSDEIVVVALVMYRDLVGEVVRILKPMAVMLKLDVVHHCFAEVVAAGFETVGVHAPRRAVALLDILVDHTVLADILLGGHLNTGSECKDTAAAAAGVRPKNWNNDGVVEADCLESMVDIVSHHNLDSHVEGEVDFRREDNYDPQAAVDNVLTGRIVVENDRSLVVVDRQYVGSTRIGNHSIVVGNGEAEVETSRSFAVATIVEVLGERILPSEES